MYSEIVPHSITADELKARNPAGVIFSGGPCPVHVRRRAIDPACLRPRHPGARHLLRRAAPGPGSPRRGGQDGARRIRASSVAHHPARRAVRRRHAWAEQQVDEPFRHHHALARTASRSPRKRPTPRRLCRVRRSRPLRCAVPSRGRAHTPRPRDPEALSVRRLWMHADVDDELDHRDIGRRNPARSATRGHLGDCRGVDSGGRARAQGNRTATHLRVRRHRPHARSEGEQVVETFRRHQGIEPIHDASPIAF